MSPMPTRPVAVTVLGWVFAIVSCLGVLGSTFVLLFAYFMPSAFFDQFPRELPPEVPAGFSLILAIFRYFVVIGILQTIVAAFSVFAAVQFLNLRPWSRAYFEILCWIRLGAGTLFVIVLSAIWISVMTSVSEPSGANMPSPGLFAAFGVATAVVVSVLNGAILGGLIWLLRSKHVRPAFLSASAPTT